MSISKYIKTISLYLLVIITSFTSSCKNNGQSNNVNQSSPILDDGSNTKIDSTQWLMPTRGIRSILEDSKGNLWFTSPDYVCKYNGETLRYFTKEDGLYIVGVVHEDKNGTIWVEDGFNIYRYDGKRFTRYKIHSDSLPKKEEIKDNNIWFQKGINQSDTTEFEPGIISFNQGVSKFYPFPVSQAENNKFIYFPTTKAVINKDSTIWFGTMEKVFGYKNGSFISLGREEMSRQNDSRQMGIRGVFADSKGNLWIADNGAGVFVYDGEKLVNFTKDHHLDEGNQAGNTLHRAFSIAEDTLGNMWIGTVYSGVWKYNPNTQEFINYTKTDGVASENIWTIYKTKKGELLFAGETPGAVYKFNGKSFERAF
jgi:hypothetical protein